MLLVPKQALGHGHSRELHVHTLPPLPGEALASVSSARPRKQRETGQDSMDITETSGQAKQQRPCIVGNATCAVPAVPFEL